MFKKASVALCFSWACLMVAAPAMAQDSECNADADCTNGFTCQVVGAYDCAKPEPAPGDGDSVDEPVDCGSGEIKMCVPPPPSACDPAQGNADCGSGLVCVTYTFEECSGGGRDDAPPCSMVDEQNGTCPEPEPVEPPTCQSKAESLCVPKYLAPCQADADCGGGFTCVAEEICTGSCSTSPVDGDSVDEPDGSEEPNCTETCTTSSQKYCQLQEVECTADADCATGLICESFNVPSEEVCTVSDDGSEPVCMSSQPAADKSYCVPPDWRQWYWGPESADHDAPTANPRDSLAGSTGNNGWEIVDAQAASANDGAASTDAEADGGCQAVGAGQAGSTAALSLLGLLGMMGWRRRRRA